MEVRLNEANISQRAMGLTKILWPLIPADVDMLKLWYWDGHFNGLFSWLRDFTEEYLTSVFRYEKKLIISVQNFHYYGFDSVADAMRRLALLDQAWKGHVKVESVYDEGEDLLKITFKMG